MTLAITGECNLRCGYCYQNAKSGRRMECLVLKKAADRLLQSATTPVDLVFAGGEPLLALDLIARAVEYAETRRPRGVEVRYSLATNGTLMSPEIISFLNLHKFEIQLSLDGVRPAQAVRGKRSFRQIEGALDHLCTDAPAIFWTRLTVGVTLDAGTVSYLSDSFEYLVSRHLRSILISPANGQSARWTPPVLEALDRELQKVYAVSRRHYADTGLVPLVSFRKSSNDPPTGRRVLCGAATSGSVTVDVDGQAYACPMFAESSQRFANPRLAATIQPMRLGHIAHRDFWRRLAELPARAEETRMFRISPDRHSLHGRCIECPYHVECRACPISVLSEPEHDDVQRIPDYICAFNWTLMSLRKKFPAQPDAAALLEGRAPKPRLVRELLERAGAGR